jgi:hypothetical protein
LQDRITESVVCSIEPRLQRAEIRSKLRQKPAPPCLDAYDLLSARASNLWERKFADCLAWCDKAVTQNSRSLPALRTKIVALVNLGRREEAVKVVQTILSVDPTFTIASWQKRNPSAHHMSERFKFMVDAYRAAGVPE